MQQPRDLWHALRSPEGKRIAKLRLLDTVIYHPGAMASRTDWDRVKNMTDEEIAEGIKGDPDAAPEIDESWMANAEIVLPTKQSARRAGRRR